MKLFKKKLKTNNMEQQFNPYPNLEDPDFNKKLWDKGIRIFKGLNDFKVYHFGSIVLRKKLNNIKKKNKYGSKGAKLFLLKSGSDPVPGKYSSLKPPTFFHVSR